jgi:hypothetical protein
MSKNTPTPRKGSSKTTKATRKAATRYGSASEEIEAIETAAGEVGTAAHRHFFNIRDMPRFIREACADATARACAQLNLPNPDETTDDLVAFQRMIDLFNATGDEFTPSPQRLIRYAPEIEARRDDYKILAVSILNMLELTLDRVDDTLDIDPPNLFDNEPRRGILFNAFDEHIDALNKSITGSGIHCQREFLTIIYPELRLYYDNYRIEAKKGADRVREDLEGGAK